MAGLDKALSDAIDAEDTDKENPFEFGLKVEDTPLTTVAKVALEQAIIATEDVEPVAAVKPATILSRIAPIKERPPYVKTLIHALPGVGKTVFAAGAPKPLLIDTEHGAISLLNHPNLATVPVLNVESFNDLNDIFWELKQEEDNPNRTYDTIVIDTISELQRKNLDEVLDKAVLKDPERSLFLPFQMDYKINTEAMRRLVTSFRDLKYNLVITSHTLEVQDEATGALMWRPAVTPKLAQTLEGVFDIIGYMTMEINESTGEVTRYLQVAPSRRIKAKTRIGGLPSILENPTFQILLDAVKATKETK